MNNLLSILALTVSFVSHSQLSDNFSDGNFTSNPEWIGTNSDFQINTDGELRIKNTISASSYLATPHALSSLNATEWRLKVRQTFSPSANNFARIYLTSSVADLSKNPDGYFLQLGEAGSTDAIRLFRSVNGLPFQICAGQSGEIASSFAIGIKVKRQANGTWELFTAPVGTENYGDPFVGLDTSALLGTFFGILGTYTSSNATKFYFDDIYVGPIIYDTTPPLALSIKAKTATSFEVVYNEVVNSNSATLINNYAFTPMVNIKTLVMDSLNPFVVHGTLDPQTPFVNGTDYTLLTMKITDLDSNYSDLQMVKFSYLVPETPLKGDVILTEVLCAPSSDAALPNAEYVEIYNRSDKYFELSGWKLGDASSSGTLNSGWLYPGEHKVLTSATNNVFFSIPTIAVSSFPSLNNSGDNVILQSEKGIVLDQLHYTDAWYHDATKANGGWALERINPNDPCSDIDNWKASVSTLGGTPGLINSVWDTSKDTVPPKLNELVVISPYSFQVNFSEGMDSTLLKTMQINIEPSLTITNVSVPNAGSSSVTLSFSEELIGSQFYKVVLTNASDCWINQANLSGFVPIPEMPKLGDLRINELLFNPYTGGSDWIEVYNHSSKLIDLKNCSIGNYDNDTIGNQKVVTHHFYLKPTEYVVLGKDSNFVKLHYPASVTGRFVYSETPTFNNDSGTVYLLYDTLVLDKVSYQDSWHFKLIDNTEGISLERIDPDENANQASNWHSASQAIGFASPGARNSQYRPVVENGSFSFTSETLSPDNDGYEDVLQINYKMLDVGLLGKVSIYDDRGRLIRELHKNELLGTDGTFTWDGVTDRNEKARIGTYILVFEAFSISGDALFSKTKAFVVAGKL